MQDHGGGLRRIFGNASYPELSLNSDLSLSEVADDTAGAMEFLARGGDALRSLSRANVFCRFLLGRQLLVIQERRLWSQTERLIGDDQNGAHCPYHSWDDFMTHGFPQMSGLSTKTGYAAVNLAKSEALQSLLEPELLKFESLSNAFQLVKLERKGVVISEELITAAQTLPVEAFRQMVGCGKKATVEVVVDSSDTARALQPIVDWLKMADPDALRELGVVVDEAMLQAGGNATDGVDNIISACREQWRQEAPPELAAVRA
jgi:hypothetical protein